MEKLAKIGIYGGTFSPPHNGHVHIALDFYERCHLDVLYIIPSFIPPHKQIDRDDDPLLRLEMTKLAFSSHPDYEKRIFVSDLELKRGGKSYTSDTIAYFKEHIGESIYFLCGTDMFVTLDTWHDPAYIFQNAGIVYARRETEQEMAILIEEKKREYARRFDGRVEQLDLSAYPISSSEIRAKCMAGENIDEWVPKKVSDFIRENRLYQRK